jgi:outer membrane protein OmpA-like peptidoglycan-associated protein
MFIFENSILSIMKRKILLTSLVISISFLAHAQQNCFDTYAGTYKLQGGFAVPDGVQKVVVAIEDSGHKALCVEGLVNVKNNAIALPVYILRENGSYSEARGKFDNRFYHDMDGKMNFGITDASTATFMLASKRKARLFFPEYLKPNGGEFVSAPSPAGTKTPPKNEDLDKIKMGAKAIQFETGKATLKKESFAMLDLIAELMHNYPDEKWAIDGYTDNTGNEEANYVLSQDRAVSVEDYLIGKGVKADVLFAAGHGADNPIADNKSSKGREQNRRVEIKPL